MAGTIVANTINTNTGLFSTNNAYLGIAKAWVNYNGVTQTILNSFNVSSVTYSAVGVYIINFTTAMPNANYAVSTSCQQSGVASGTSVGTFTPSTTSLELTVSYYNTVTNSPQVGAIVFGN